MLFQRRRNLLSLSCISIVVCFLLVSVYYLCPRSSNVTWQTFFGTENLSDKYKQLFINNQKQLGFSNKNNSSPANSNAQRFSRTSDFKTFFEATERIRALSLLKRETILFADNGPSETLLWPKDNDVYVWHYFPPDFTCPHLQERVGSPSDGGKWMCGINLFQESQDKCVVYSIGVGGDSSFEIEMALRTNCDVFAYDHTVNKMNLNAADYPKIRFRKLGLGRSSAIDVMGSTKFKSLKQIMDENGHTWIDFLKMDVEGAEFEIFKGISEDFESFPFGHLNVEIHLGNYNHDQTTEQKKSFKRFYDTWNLLEEKGLRAFTWEENMVPCKLGGKPSLMEYSFINCKDKRNKLIQF